METIGGDSADRMKDRMEGAARAACSGMEELGREMRRASAAMVPPEVTEHLVRAQVEMVRAGQRLGDLMIERLERKAQEARDVHEEIRRRRENPPTGESTSNA